MLFIKILFSVNSDAEVNDQQASGDSVVQLLTATTWKK